MDKFSSKERKKARKRCQSPLSSSADEKYKKRRHSQGDDKPGKSWKRKERKNSFSEPSGSSSSENDQDKIRKKRRKAKKKEKKRRKDKQKKDKQEKRKKNGEEGNNASELSGTAVKGEDLVTVLMPPENQATKRRPMVPMTKEEYERQQSQIRRVFDPETGRHRLVRGDGEVIEEVVSYQRHKEINKLATEGDGTTFQKSLGLQK